MKLGKYNKVLLLFAVAGLLGPLLRWLTWPPSSFQKSTSAEVEDFIASLTLFLWPSQPFAVVEIAIGQFLAVLYSVAINVFVFTVVGCISIIAVIIGVGLFLVYLITAILLWLFALWTAGFDVIYINIYSYIASLIFYAMPFILSNAVLKRNI